MVSDIYKDTPDTLVSNSVASAFGKIASSKLSKEDIRKEVSDSDIAKSLVNMICYNIGQISNLVA